MKKIALIPTKNEAYFLPTLLQTLDSCFDHIIIADQMSDDGSRDVCKEHPKVIMIDNLHQNHSNAVRWDLLNTAREFAGNNFILCIDADERISPQRLNNFVENCNYKPGNIFKLNWVQLWKSISEYRSDNSIFSDIWKPVAFIDDRKMGYPSKIILNDHTKRVPGRFEPERKITDLPLLHYQWVTWERTQYKQAWYKCSELLFTNKKASIINGIYSHGLDTNGIICKNINPYLTDGVFYPKDILNAPITWHKEKIIQWFEEHGVLKFENLQIFHLKELFDYFVKKTAREPNMNIEIKLIENKYKELKIKSIIKTKNIIRNINSLRY